MKLLAKQEIATLKAKERQTAIEEGLKIARRVDGLREVAAQEEKSLAEFRITTLTVIQEEIDTKCKHRDALCAEVVELEKRKKEALAPITKELGKLERDRQELLDKEREVSRELYSLEATKEGVAESIKALKQKEIVIESNKRLTEEALIEVDNLRKEALIAKRDAIKIANELAVQKTNLETEYDQFTKSSKATEERHAKRDQEQDEREIQLNAFESQLRDREGVLERNIKRLLK